MRVRVAVTAAMSGRLILHNRSSSLSCSKFMAWWRSPPPCQTQASRLLGSLRMGEGLQGPSSVRGALAADASRPRPLLRECIQAAPSEPGVYIMESADGQKLYIGKSVKLSSRVSSYFSGCTKRGEGGDGESMPSSVVLPGANLSRRIAVMTVLVERIDYIATASGAEALLLEASMIRQHQPPFNILLKDDKRNYPYACVTWSEPYPRLLITRDRPRRGGGAEDRYYGPFVDAGQLKATIALVRRVLPLRERRRPLYKDKPCLNHDLGLCPGPCQGLVSEDDYAETVRLAEMVFKGEGGELLARLQGRMEGASRAERFEQAEEIKTQIALVRGGLLGSALHFSSRGAAAGRGWAQDDDLAARQGKRGGGGGGIRRDVVAVGRAGNLACFQLFQVRGGRLTGRLGFTYRVEEGEGEGGKLSRGEVLQACLERYWGGALESRAGVGASLGGVSPPSSSEGEGGKGGVYVADVPDEIVTADALPDGGAEILSDLLSAARGASAVDADIDAGANADDNAYANPDANADANADVIADAIANASADAERGAAGQQGGVTRPTNRKAEKGGKAPERRTCGSIPPVAVVHGGANAGGERHHLCVMVLKNAELEAKRLRRGGEDTARGLAQLARMLGLASPPTRIEGYDVSHTGGGQAVASAVSFVDGKARRDEHRRYRIWSTEVRKGHSDDYASLREVIARRFAPPSQSRLRGAAAAAEGTADVAVPRPVPDLVLIDGGRGQLAAAIEGAADAADAWRSVGRDAETIATALPAEGVAISGVPPNEQKNEARQPSSSLLLSSSSSSSPPSCTSSTSSFSSPPSSISSTSSSVPSSNSTPSSSSSAPSSSSSSPSSSLSSSFTLTSSVIPSPSHLGRAVSDEDPDAILLSPTPPSADLVRVATRAGVGMGASANNGNSKINSNSNSASVDVGGGRRVAMVSLAKKEEEVYVKGAMEPLSVTGVGGEAGPHSPGVMILRQVRDEAHRFAVEYHRMLRSRDMFLPTQIFRGAEDDTDTDDGQRGFSAVPGLSSKAREALAEAFGSLEGARVAGEAELRRIPGIGPTLAKRILSH